MLPLSPFPGIPPLSSQINRALRVDLAGEQGAKTIYTGQLKALGTTHSLTPIIQEMAAAEIAHARAFENLLATHHARPSLLTPFWERAGFLIGFLTGWMGGPAAMACTAAVEEVIDQHYHQQVLALEAQAPELTRFLNQCREEEQEHLHTGLAHGANQAPFSQTLQAMIRFGTRCAVFIAERI